MKKAVCAKVREKKNPKICDLIIEVFAFHDAGSQTYKIQKGSNLKFLFYRRKIKNIGLLSIEIVLNTGLKYEIQQF